MFENTSRALLILSRNKSQDLRHSLITQFKMHFSLVNLKRLMCLLVKIGPREHDAIGLVVEQVHELLLLELDDAVSEEELVRLKHY